MIELGILRWGTGSDPGLSGWTQCILRSFFKKPFIFYWSMLISYNAVVLVSIWTARTQHACASGLLLQTPSPASLRCDLRQVPWSSGPCLVAQLCLALCNSPWTVALGSTVHGIFKQGILEWVAIFTPPGIFLTRGSTRVSCIATIHNQLAVGSPIGLFILF